MGDRSFATPGETAKAKDRAPASVDVAAYDKDGTSWGADNRVHAKPYSLRGTVTGTLLVIGSDRLAVDLTSSPCHDRAIREIAALRFLPALERLHLNCDFDDISLLAELPALHELFLSSPACEDFRPLARCANLRLLSLNLQVPWPEEAGLEKLWRLEGLSLGGNPLVFPPSLIFPNVREGKLNCCPPHAFAAARVGG